MALIGEIAAILKRAAARDDGAIETSRLLASELSPLWQCDMRERRRITAARQREQ